MKRLLLLILLSVFGFRVVHAQQFSFPRVAVVDSALLSESISGLAGNILLGYKTGNDLKVYQNNLFRLQTLAGAYREAIATIASLRGISKESDPLYSDLLLVQYELFAKAKQEQAEANVPFDQAFAHVFQDFFSRLDDKSALHIATAFQTRNGVAELQSELQKSLIRLKDTLSLNDAITLCRNYYLCDVYKNIEPLAIRLLKEDDNKRYIIEDSVLIKTKVGATLSAIVVRQRSITTPQPATLFFNIYTEISMNAAKRAASYGFVSVVAETRGKRYSPDAIEPYEHEVEDTYNVIDWISKQSWCNGKVGMYGGSYSGYACWAATKKLHPALKTIVPYCANNPGDGLPMENNIFLFVNYPWAFYVGNNRYLDNATYFDQKRWHTLNTRWYESGVAYSRVDSIDGTPNKWLHRWLMHPSYDNYWQEKAPYKEEFAKISIPVLTITGYYDDGQQSALWYMKEHDAYNKDANHYLVIGPYDHFGAQASRKPSVLGGYAIDSVAQFDTPDLTFQWMDYILRGGKKPEMLKDKINYEVMGANEWKYAPSLEQVSNETLTLYLTDAKVDSQYRLSGVKPSKPGFLTQEVDFRDRKTMNNDYYPSPIVGRKPDLSNGFSFISEPFDEPVEISGSFSGAINAIINKKDMDIGVVLYEVMSNGELFQLSYHLGRASYAKDMSHRKLLTPGKVESIPFDKTRMVSRRLGKGSRLLVTLNINKNPFAQINYGTGKDVSVEGINDAKTPLKIQWQNDSYVKIPVWR